MAHRNLRYREALPDERESSDFLICACCGVRVIGFVLDDEYDTIRRTTPNLSLQRSEREHAWLDDRLTRERDHENDRHTLEPPEDKNSQTLVVCGFNSRFLEQNILEKFATYGGIKSIRFFAREGRALVTYTDREGAEKATQGLPKCLLINGQRLKLAWGMPQDHEPDQDSLNQQGTVARSGLLSQQQNRPSAMDLQDIGAVISTQEVGDSSTSENNEASSSNTPIICEHCRVTGAAVDEFDTIRRTTPNLTPQRSEREHAWRDDRLTRERERAWRVCNNDRWTREREHTPATTIPG